MLAHTLDYGSYLRELQRNGRNCYRGFIFVCIDVPRPWTTLRLVNLGRAHNSPGRSVDPTDHAYTQTHPGTRPRTLARTHARTHAERGSRQSQSNPFVRLRAVSLVGELSEYRVKVSRREQTLMGERSASRRLIFDGRSR